MLRLCGVGQNDQNHIVVTLFPRSVTAIQVWAKSPRLQSCNSRADLPFSLHELPAPFRRRCPARSFRRSWPGIPCRRSFGSQSANRATEAKNRYTNRPKKLSLLGRPPVPFYVAIQFVLKLLRLLWMLWESSWNIYNEFSIFNCLVSIPRDDIKRQPFLTPMSEFQQAAIKETENFAKTPKENPCQQILISGLRLSTASHTGCKCSKANVVVANLPISVKP